MRANFSCRLLYSDTDSLLYKLESDYNYYEVEKQTKYLRNEFNISSYRDGHAPHNDANKC